MSNTFNVTVRPTRAIVAKPSRQSSVLVNQQDLLNRLNNLEDLLDVDASAKTDGSVLVYDETSEKFVATTLLDKQTFNGGHF